VVGAEKVGAGGSSQVTLVNYVPDASPETGEIGQEDLLPCVAPTCHVVAGVFILDA
jgi:hypothetical protein